MRLEEQHDGGRGVVTAATGGRRALGLPLAGLVFLLGCTPPGPRALLEGERLVKAGKYGPAIVQLNEATRLMPQSAPAWNHLGLAYHGGGLPMEAASAYRKALALDKNLAAARYNLGCLLLEQNSPASATSAAMEFASYTVLQPGVLDGWVKLGIAQLRARQYEGAERTFRYATNVNPRLPEALNGLGLVLLQRNRMREAAQAFTAALQAQPDCRPALLNLAIVNHQHLNNRPLALQHYKRFLALTPRPYHYDTVVSVVRQLELELTSPPPAPLPPTPPPGPATNRPLTATSNVMRESVRSETIQVRTNAGGAPVVSQMTVATNLPKLILPPPITNAAAPAHPATDAIVPKPPATVPGKPAAPEMAAATPSRAPVLSVASTNPAPVYARYAYRSPAKPAAGNRREAERLLGLGLQAQQERRLAEALTHYEAAIQADPACFEAHYNLGVAAYEHGDLKRALTADETALAINANAANARFNFALALRRAGHPREAADELEQFLKANAQDVRARLMLANLYAQQLLQPVQARPHYQRVLELDPRHAEAAAIQEWLSKHGP